MEETIAQWDLFIWKTIRSVLKYNVSEDEQDEVYQDVCLRLVKMPEDKRRFNSYVCTTIINEVRVRARFILRGVHLRNPIPVLKGLKQYDGNNDEPMEIATPDQTEQSEARILLEQLAQDIKPEYRDALSLLMQGYTIDEIGEMCGKSRAWAGYVVRHLRSSPKARAMKRMSCEGR